MKSLIAMVLLLGLLAACQSIPKERKNNCACNWESLAEYAEETIT